MKGFEFIPSFCLLRSSSNESETPTRTNREAAFRLAIVMRLSVPSSSSFPQRPQFEMSDIHRSNSAAVTRAGAVSALLQGAAPKTTNSVVSQ